jgi:hypothetical protein
MENEVINQSKPDWGKLLEEQEKSGLSQAEFCRQHEIEPSKFSYYRVRIKKKQRADDSNRGEFKRVHVASVNANDEIKIVLPNGCQCIVSYRSDVLQIKKIIEVLMSC